MKHAKYLLIALAGLLTLTSTSQNLAKMWNFEGGACNYPTNMTPLTSWFRPTNSTPDYLNSCNTANPQFKTPSNFVGYQQPRSGNAYYHLFVFAKNSNKSTEQREYISDTLVSPLKAGKRYCAEMYVNLGNKSVLAIDEIGMLFSNGAITCTGFSCLINASPQVTSPNGVALKDTLNWVKVSGTFIASGGENILTIGNFKSDALTDTFRVQKGFGYSQYLIEDVAIREIPTASIAGNTIICAGTSTILTAGSGLGYSYVWNTGATTQSITVNPTTSTIYTVVVSNGACANDSASVTITVNPKPIATIVGNLTICLGSSTTLTAGGGTSYLWNTGATSNAINVSPTASTSYSVTVSNGSCSDTKSVNVIVSPAPIASITGNNSICNGASTTITANGGSGNYSYSWNTGSTTQSISMSPTVTTTYSVIISAGSCSDTASITVVVNQPPAVNISGTTDICKGDLVNLKAQSGNGITYSWSTGSTTQNISVTPIVSTIYTVTASNGGCSTSSTFSVSVHDVTSSFNASTEKGPASLNVVFNNTSINGVTYQWNFGDSDSSSLINPSHVYNNPGTYLVKLTTTNSFGCSDVSFTTIVVEDIPSIFVPNAFTPNGDGLNDLFMAKCANIDPEHFNMEIFDRWGNEIFHTNDITAGWDGRANSGNALAQMDVYVWKINAKELDTNRYQKFMGHVALVR